MPDNVEQLRDDDQDSAAKIREGLKGNTEAENVDTGADDDGDDSDNQDTPPKKDTKPKVDDEKAKLLKETMKHKQAAKQAALDLKALQESLEGIDLAVVKQMLVDKEEQEDKALEKKGEFDRLLEKQKEAAAAKIKAEKDRADAAEAATAKLSRQIEDLTIGAGFSNSKFVTDKLVLTPNKAKALYKSHFEFVDGKVVAYDKPAGEADRTPIVDDSGSAVDFDAAIAAIIDADPDKDFLLKAEQKQGANSKPNSSVQVQKDNKFVDTTDMIAAGLAQLSKKK